MLVLNCSSYYRAEFGSSSYPHAKIKEQFQPQPTSFELLLQMQSYLPRLIEETRIGYINLVRKCNRLPKKIRQGVEAKLGKVYDMTKRFQMRVTM
jgi:hypothetical protein